MSEIKSKKRLGTGARIMIVILFFTPFIIIGTMTYLELSKSPLNNFSLVEIDKLNNGYDLVCDYRNGMQLCMMNHTKQNMFGIFKDNVRIEYGTNPCLNYYLVAENKTTGKTVINDMYGFTNSSSDSCQLALRFNIADGWGYGSFAESTSNETGNKYGLYYAEKIFECGWPTILRDGRCSVT